MRTALGPGWELSLRDGRARILRRRDGVAVAALSAGDAAALMLMDGRRDLKEIALILETAGQARAERTLAGLVARLEPLLVDGRPRSPHEGVDDLDAIRTPSPEDGFRFLPGPRTLQWWVTRYCPRSCTYCYAHPLRGSAAPDATIQRARLAEIFAEAAELGARTLMVTGGEPLLRSDLPEVLGDAVAAGLEPALTTKHPISPALAARFAAAGVTGLSLSLDSLDPDHNRRLVGDRRHADGVRRSTANLRAAGIAFGIQAVATRETEGDLDDLAAFTAEVGAQVLLVSAFVPPPPLPAGPPASAPAGAPTPPYRPRLAETVQRLAERFAPLRVELFEPTSPDDPGRAYCDIGITRLFFLPDGRVHRCYRLLFDETLVGADLTTASVAEAWHDAGFSSLLSPPRRAYAGSECGSCRRFEACHRDGRCIYRAVLDHGTHAARDRDCGGPFVAAGTEEIYQERSGGT